MTNTSETILVNGNTLFRFSHEAMATVFTLLISHENMEYASQAAAAAWAECDRLEQDLSLFIENSDISRLNTLPMNAAVTVGIDTYECLRICSELTLATGGAFDVTLGTAARPAGDEPVPPFLFDPDTYTVTRTHPRARIDPGGIGKGYAVDRIAALLEEWDIITALISGGRSSVLALDPPPGGAGWPVSISHPVTGTVLQEFALAHRCLSGSGLEKGDHIIDPRTGKPVTNRIAAWSLCPSAAAGDGLSTAFMVMEEHAVATLCAKKPGCGALIIGLGDSLCTFGASFF